MSRHEREALAEVLAESRPRLKAIAALLAAIDQRVTKPTRDDGRCQICQRHLPCPVHKEAAHGCA